MERDHKAAGEVLDDRFYGEPDDDTPELTKEALARSIPGHQFFAERGMPIPGRPPSDDKKIAVSIRLDQAIVEAFKADGPGWQTRMNAVLAESVKARAAKP